MSLRLRVTLLTCGVVALVVMVIATVFFITVGATPHLNRKHTIFGEVTDPASREVVDKIAAVPTGRNDRPQDDVVIESVDITGRVRSVSSTPLPEQNRSGSRLTARTSS